MKEMWNSTLLSPPPCLTYEVRGERIGAAALSRICSEAISVLNDQEALHQEAAMLSRFLYHTKVKMRFDKGFMYLSKVNRCLLQYLSMNLLAAYTSLRLSEEDECGCVCAPSKQRLEYLLVRTQGFAQLFCHIMRVCESAAYYMMCRLHLGQMWDMALVALGIISRIWTISKYLVMQSCKWYNSLICYRDILQPIGLPWLPADYEFPKDLTTWVQSPSLTMSTKMRSNNRDKWSGIFSLINLDTVDDPLDKRVSHSLEEAIETKTEEVLKHSSNIEIAESRLLPQTEDIGELVTSTPLLPAVTLDSGQNGDVAKRKGKKDRPSGEVARRKRKKDDQNCEVARRKKRKDLKMDYGIKDEILKETVSENNNSEHDTEEDNFNKSNMHVSKKKKKTKEIKSEQKVENIHVESGTTVKDIKVFKSVIDVKKFLVRECKRRKSHLEHCVTKGLDKMQWHMLERAMDSYVQKLSSGKFIEGSSEYRKLLKKARREILIRLQ